MSEWPSTKARRVYRALLAIGWMAVSQAGSHVKLRHRDSRFPTISGRFRIKRKWPSHARAHCQAHGTPSVRFVEIKRHRGSPQLLLFGATRIAQVKNQPSSSLIDYALAAFSLPSGRKYWVPLIGAETFFSSSCRSSLRSTKSISLVFTISRSDWV